MRKNDCLILANVWTAVVVLMPRHGDVVDTLFCTAAFVFSMAWFVAFFRTK